VNNETDFWIDETNLYLMCTGCFQVQFNAASKYCLTFLLWLAMSAQKTIAAWGLGRILTLVIQVLIILAGPSFLYSVWWHRITGSVSTDR